MVIDNVFEIGTVVYLKTDEDQRERMIYGICVFGKGEIVYKVCQGTTMSEHYDFELSDQKDVLKQTTN